MQEIIRGGEEDAIMIAGRSEGWGKGIAVVRDYSGDPTPCCHVGCLLFSHVESLFPS